MSSATSSTGRLPTSQVAAYAALIGPTWMMHVPALTVMPALYAKHAGINIVTLGLVLMLARIFDVVTDPLVGFLSDRTSSPIGHRKPWILAGAVICAVAVYFQFRPGPDTGIVYFFCWSIALYLGWTLIEIPHSAWLSELTHDYDERTRLAGFRTAAMYGGDIVFKMSPLLPLFVTTEMTPEVTAFVSWIVIATLPPLALLAIARVGEGTAVSRQRPPLAETARAIWANIPFRRYFTMKLIAALSSGMVGGLYFFFLDAYLGILERFAHVGLTVAVVSLLSTTVWPSIIRKMEKHHTIAICNAAVVATLIAMAFIRPGPYAFPALALIFGLSAFFAAGAMIALIALLADVVDYDTWKTREHRAGNYFAFHALSEKLGVAIGGGVALVMVGLFGFNAMGNNDSFAMTGFYLTFIGVPIVLNSITVYIAIRFPLNRQTQERIAGELEARGDAEMAGTR